MSKEEREKFCNGRKDENGKTVDRGVLGIRGPKAVEDIKATMDQLQSARASGQ
jgi:hypothetical protein